MKHTKYYKIGEKSWGATAHPIARVQQPLKQVYRMCQSPIISTDVKQRADCYFGKSAELEKRVHYKRLLSTASCDIPGPLRLRDKFVTGRVSAFM